MYFDFGFVEMTGSYLMWVFQGFILILFCEKCPVQFLSESSQMYFEFAMWKMFSWILTRVSRDIFRFWMCENDGLIYHISFYDLILNLLCEKCSAEYSPMSGTYPTWISVTYFNFVMWKNVQSTDHLNFRNEEDTYLIWISEMEIKVGFALLEMFISCLHRPFRNIIRFWICKND